MTALFAIFLILLPLPADAVYFQVLGRGGQELYSADETVDIPSSIGAITIHFLEKARKEKGLAYEGDEQGIVSIDGLAPEFKDMGNGEIRSYGWCFSVNGYAPEELPNYVEIHDPHARIVWFYGYSVFYDEWFSPCTPAN